MKRTTLLGLAALLLAAFPFTSPANPCDDPDGDGICAEFDDCLDQYDPTQTDTDGDFCGNGFDGDFDQSGTVSIGDWGSLVIAWRGPGIPPGLQDIGEDLPSGTIAINDFGEFAAQLGMSPGPSGTTPGTYTCP